jgi:thiol-disulfide isomerase/thioredoxin
MGPAPGIVVLNFWASWCQPCVHEIPVLQRVFVEYADRGVLVQGASIDEPEDRAKATRLFAKLGARYPTRFTDAAEMKSLLLGTSIPATVVFDRDGRPAFRVVGEVSAQAMRTRLDWLLGERTTPAPGELSLPRGITAEHFKEHEAGEDHDHADEHASNDERGSAVPG